MFIESEQKNEKLKALHFTFYLRWYDERSRYYQSCCCACMYMYVCMYVCIEVALRGITHGIGPGGGAYLKVGPMSQPHVYHWPRVMHAGSYLHT